MSYVVPDGEEHAVGHDRLGNPLTGLDLETANAANSLYASALDYARFLIVASGLEGTDPRSWARLMRVQATVEPRLGMYWGLGWAVERDLDGNRTVFHWGSNPGFKSFALPDPDRQLGLVILTNGDHGLELVQRIVGILDPVPHPLLNSICYTQTIGRGRANQPDDEALNLTPRFAQCRLAPGRSCGCATPPERP